MANIKSTAVIVLIIAAVIITIEAEKTLESSLPFGCHDPFVYEGPNGTEAIEGYTHIESPNGKEVGYFLSRPTLKKCERLILLNGRKPHVRNAVMFLSKDKCEEVCVVQCRFPFHTKGFRRVVPDWALGQYSSQPRNQYKVVAWYLNPIDEACKPLYSNKGIHYYDGNQNWPQSKRECDQLCGSSCIYLNKEINLPRSEKTYMKYKPGFCSYDQFCIGAHQPSSFGTCSNGNDEVNCCPTNFNYTMPIIPVSEEPSVINTHNQFSK